MEPKKSRKADVERKTRQFFLVGLIISMGAAIVAFQWKVYDVQKPELTSDIEIDEPEEIADITQHVKKEEFPLIIDETPEPVEKAKKKLKQVVPTPDEPAFEPTLIDTFKNIDPIIKEDEPAIFVEDMPEFPGGEAALFNYLGSKIKYPEMERKNGIEGTVVVEFIVGKDGEVEHAAILKGLTKDTEKEALRVIRGLPKWKPGSQNGKTVRVRMMIPIRFKLMN